MALPSVSAKLFSVIVLFVAVITAYVLVIRPSQLGWGATPEEIARAMPGDDLVRQPTFSATRAITIRGRREDVWPWIVQMGYDRAGFYGYDLIENIGSKRGIRSAEQIVPELQHPAVGDRVYMSRIAYLSFDSIVRDQYLIWKGIDSPPDSSFTWALYPVGANQTRLVSRIRIRYHWTDRRIVLDLFTEFADPVAVPRILAGVKARVEGRGPEPLGPQAFEIAVWTVVLFEFIASVVLLFRWRRWWPAWMLALASTSLLLFAFYARRPVWVGASLGLVLGAVLWRCQTNSRKAEPATRGGTSGENAR
jgi:hypothetical protein